MNAEEQREEGGFVQDYYLYYPCAMYHANVTYGDSDSAVMTLTKGPIIELMDGEHIPISQGLVIEDVD